MLSTEDLIETFLYCGRAQSGILEPFPNDRFPLPKIYFCPDEILQKRIDFTPSIAYNKNVQFASQVQSPPAAFMCARERNGYEDDRILPRTGRTRAAYPAG